MCVCVYACVQMYCKWHAAPQMWIPNLILPCPHPHPVAHFCLYPPGQLQLQVFAHAPLQCLSFPLDQIKLYGAIFVMMPSPSQNQLSFFTEFLWNHLSDTESWRCWHEDYLRIRCWVLLWLVFPSNPLEILPWENFYQGRGEHLMAINPYSFWESVLTISKLHQWSVRV